MPLDLRAFFRIAAIAVGIASAIGSWHVPTAQAQAPDDVDVAPRAAPASPNANDRAFTEDFDQLVLDSTAPDASAVVQARLNQMLSQQIGRLDRHYVLSQLQKQKLKLAGQGDIRRLQDQIERQRQEFVAARRNGIDDKIRAAFGEVATLHLAVKSGPFGAGSLFAKAQSALLSPEQRQKYQRRRQLAARSTAKITVENASALETAGRFQKDVYRIGWTNRDNEVALLQFGSAVEVCSADNLQHVRTIGNDRKLVGFDFAHNGSLVALAENSYRALLVNLATGEETVLLTKNQQPAVSLSPDGKLVATGGDGTRASLWSVDSAKRMRDLDIGATAGGLWPVFSPDGKILAVGSRNSSTCLFDVATGKLLHRLSWQSSQELKFDPSGKRLAVAYADGKLAIWSVESGELLQRAKPHAEELYSVDWSADGSLLASSGRRAPITLWRAADLTPLNEIDGPEWVICVRFNPAGTRLIFAGGAAHIGGERYLEMLGVPQE
jgi:WD40 repeat protein